MADQAMAEMESDVTTPRRSKGKIAWCTSPLLNGVTTAYRVVGRGLREAGWEVTAVTAGRAPTSGLYPGFEIDSLENLLPGSSDVRRNAAEFVRWVREQKIDVVLSTEQDFTVAAAPALPSEVRLVHRCGCITRQSYEVVVTNAGRSDAIITQSPRQHQDLIQRWGVPEEKCTLIPLGIEVEHFGPGSIRGFDAPLRLVYMGRLDEGPKGVMLLPRIAAGLTESGVEYRLDIVGDGPDRDRLEAAFASADLLDRTTFHGALERDNTLPILQRAHVFLLASRYEAQSWALLETMSCGCVPVVSRIRGVTDFPITHGVNGFLCAVGKAPEFSSAVARLAENRNELRALSQAASRTVRERFSVTRAVRAYSALFEKLLGEDPPPHQPIPLDSIEVPRAFERGWRSFLPQPVKNYARTWAARLGVSV